MYPYSEVSKRPAGENDLDVPQWLPNLTSLSLDSPHLKNDQAGLKAMFADALEEDQSPL